MARNTSNQNDQNSGNQEKQQSVGNQQQTSQTGAQNSGGENIDEQEDQYTNDLKESGNRSSSNSKDND